MIQDDAALVERVLSGDKSAFGPLIDRHWPKALSLALRSLGNLADAEDAVQDAFVQALLGLPSLRQTNRFGPWLCGMVLNLCRMHKRAQRNGRVLEEDNGILASPEWTGANLQPSAEALYATREAHRILLAALEALPAEQQRAIRLHYLDGLPPAEIALMVGVPVGAVKVRLHRARNRLRVALAGEIHRVLEPIPRVEEVLMIDATTSEAMTGSSGGSSRLPVVPTRDIIVFPHMVIPLFIGRWKSRRAIEEAAATNKLLFLTAQRDAKINDPSAEDLYDVGTLATVAQLLHLPDGTMKVAVEGQRRGRILRYLDHPDFFLAEIEEAKEKHERTSEIAKLMLDVTTAFTESGLNLKKTSLSSEMVRAITAIEDPDRLADTIVSQLKIELEAQQELLETFDPTERLQQILGYLSSRPEFPTAQIQRTEKQPVGRSEEQRTAQEIVNIVQPYLDGWKARDIACIVEAVTDDFVFEDRPASTPAPVRGKVQFQEYLTALLTALPNLSFTTTNPIASEGQVWLEWTISGTYTGSSLNLLPTGKQITIRGAAILQVRGGKVAQARLYWDSGSVLRQLGVLA